MSKPTIIPNWKYQKPSKGGYRGLKKLLKYVSNRESPDHRPVEIDERWTDCGLGKGWLAGPYVRAHHLVIAPAPDLMELVPDELKHDLVRGVTERTIEAWHEARGLNTPEFSYVLHDRDTDDEYGMQMLHTHVFVAGKIENSLGERESHRVDRQQVCTDRGGLNREDNLHHIARHEFETLLDRTIGREWRLLRDPELGQEQAISLDIDAFREEPDRGWSERHCKNSSRSRSNRLTNRETSNTSMWDSDTDENQTPNPTRTF